MTLWQLVRAAVDVPVEVLVQMNKQSDRISVPFLFFFQQASVQMRCFCICFTAAGGTGACVVAWGVKRVGVWGWPLSWLVCRGAEPGVPKGRWGTALARSHSPQWVTHQERRNLYCRALVMRWSRISQALKDVLMPYWKPVMMSLGLCCRLKYLSSKCVFRVQCSWTGTVIKGRGRVNGLSQATLVEICLHKFVTRVNPQNKMWIIQKQV